MYIQPDINPIENVWAALKKKVERKVKYMVIKNTKISQEDFLDIVQQERHDLDNNILLQCIDSMRDWIKACIDAEGGQTIIDLIIKYVALVLVFYLK